MEAQKPLVETTTLYEVFGATLPILRETFSEDLRVKLLSLRKNRKGSEFTAGAVVSPALWEKVRQKYDDDGTIYQVLDQPILCTVAKHSIRGMAEDMARTDERTAVMITEADYETLICVWVSSGTLPDLAYWHRVLRAKSS